ncbi:MAG: thiamine-binding protein [Candidatus Sericytochromatia bacterium]|nr:thiamine-binding protein [Candidatus Tanganyikabacteria bacterium]
MVVAEITIIPVSAGGDMRPCIDAAIGEFERAGLRFEVGALGTTVEGPLNRVMEAAIAAHQAAMRLGTERVITEIRLDERLGQDLTIDREVAGYRITMAESPSGEAAPGPAPVPQHAVRETPEVLERAHQGWESVRTKPPRV